MKLIVLTIGILMSGHAFGQVRSICSEKHELAKESQFRAIRGLVADGILVDKSRKLLHLMSEGEVIRTFHVALGRKSGKKRQEGDQKTPEGLYSIGYKNSESSYHLSLQISYPNKSDIDWARKNGVSPGGSIMLHGLPNEKWKWGFLGHPRTNWTAGCIAVTNSEIEEIWSLVRTGTIIEICP